MMVQQVLPLVKRGDIPEAQEGKASQAEFTDSLHSARRLEAQLGIPMN